MDILKFNIYSTEQCKSGPLKVYSYIQKHGEEFLHCALAAFKLNNRKFRTEDLYKLYTAPIIVIVI
jgi:hypothetical protein